MAELYQTAVTLRFLSDDLDPEEISNALGRQPTTGARKGGVWLNPAGRQMIARIGFWRLTVEREIPGDLDKQIATILGSLNDDASVWRSIARKGKAEVFAGLMLGQSNEGINISADTLLALGARGLSLELDIYSGTDDGQGEWQTATVTERP